MKNQYSCCKDHIRIKILIIDESFPFKHLNKISDIDNLEAYVPIGYSFHVRVVKEFKNFQILDLLEYSESNL